MIKSVTRDTVFYEINVFSYHNKMLYAFIMSGFKTVVL